MSDTDDIIISIFGVFVFAIVLYILFGVEEIREYGLKIIAGIIIGVITVVAVILLFEKE